MITAFSEDQIERAAEHEMDVLDRLLLRGALTQEQYDSEVIKLDKWCEDHYAARCRHV